MVAGEMATLAAKTKELSKKIPRPAKIIMNKNLFTNEIIFSVRNASVVYSLRVILNLSYKKSVNNAKKSYIV